MPRMKHSEIKKQSFLFCFVFYEIEINPTLCSIKWRDVHRTIVAANCKSTMPTWNTNKTQPTSYTILVLYFLFLKISSQTIAELPPWSMTCIRGEPSFSQLQTSHWLNIYWIKWRNLKRKCIFSVGHIEYD